MSTDVTNHIVLQGEEKHLSETGNQVSHRLDPDIRDVHALSTNAQTKASIISNKVDDDLLKRQAIVRFVRDSIAESVDKQKEQADKKGRKNKETYIKGELVLLSTANLRDSAVSNLGSNKLLPRYIGPFKVLKRLGDAYTLEIPRGMRLHPTFYVGRLKRYHSSRLEDQLEVSHPPLEQSAMDRLDSSATYPQSPVEQESESEIEAEASRNACSSDSHDPLTPSEFLRSLPRDDDTEGHTTPLNHHRVLSGQSNVSERAPNSLLNPLPLRKSPQDRIRVSANDYRSHCGDQHRPLCSRNSQSLSPGDKSQSQLSRPPPIIDSRGEKLYLVEKIVDHSPREYDEYEKKKRGRHVRHYRVQWIGYPSDQDSWIPRDQLIEDVPGLVETYEKEHPYESFSLRRN